MGNRKRSDARRKARAKQADAALRAPVRTSVATELVQQEQFAAPSPTGHTESPAAASAEVDAVADEGPDAAIATQAQHVPSADCMVEPGSGHVVPTAENCGVGDQSDESDPRPSIKSDAEIEHVDAYEPMFKYEHIGGTLHDVCARDTISALAAATDRVAVGMHSGMIYVLHTDGSLERGFRFHTAAVNSLVFDTTGEFVASAGLDGLVAIASLHTSEQYVFDFQRPVRTVALEPGFSRRSSRAFVCGGMAGALVHRDKRWFGYKETIIHTGEGPVSATAWHTRWIAWANDRGVRIADMNTLQVVSLIPTQPGTSELELARCSLEWRDDSTLVIAHGDRITVASVRPQSADEPQGFVNLFPGAAPKVYVEVTGIFQLDSTTCGLALLKEHMLVLAHVPDQQHSELRAVSGDGEELDSAVLSLGDSPRFRSNDYHLLGSLERRLECTTQKEVLGAVFYAASPVQVVAVRPRDERDHIDYLLAQKDFAEALAYIDSLGSAAQAMDIDVDAVGHAYLDHLVALHDYEGAAAQLAPLLGTDTCSWEAYVFLFVEHDQVPVVLPHIPLSDPQLSEVLYEMVLASLIRQPTLLCDTLQRWPEHLYSTAAVAAALEDQCAGDRSEVLTEALAYLYLANHQPARALQHFLVLGRPIVLDLLAEHNLFPTVRDRLGELIALEIKHARTDRPPRSLLVDLLVAHMHSVPISRVMSQLRDAPWYEYKYLDALSARDPQLVSEYGGVLVALYAQYDYAKLLPFLRVVNVEFFSEAYEICRKHDYVPEMVFILGRTGDNPGALALILERLGDVYKAIDFAKQQDDPDLWTRLLEYSQDRPDFIRALLEHVGGEIDPLQILRRIRNGLAVPGLKYALMKILHNFNLQVSLLQGCSAVLCHGARDAGEHLQKAQRVGLYSREYLLT